jgi:hypothetical protein
MSVGKDEETKRNDDNVPIAATCEVLSLTPDWASVILAA